MSDVAPLAAQDRESFIAAHTRLTQTPHAPSVLLHVADEATTLWEKTEEELGELGLPPPFWAFAWAGGQALARYLLDNPTIVRGKRVFDLASGSGLVAIAAAKAGAACVIANEIDEFALAAISLNAKINHVAIEIMAGDVVGRAINADVICAGDVFYERDMASRIEAWLRDLAANGVEALVGDPGRSYFPKDRLEKLAEYQVPVTRALEDAEIKRTAVWRLSA